MGAQLAGTVYVKDPDTHQTVRLEPGTCPEARLAALVTNPGAWVDGKLPRLPKAKTEDESPSVDGQGDGSGGDSDPSDAADTESEPEGDDTKPAARKTAARKPARGRTTAAEGTSGQ